MPSRPKVSIGIKTLNEAKNIARAIESALAAVAPFDGEVVIADSGSTDQTIAIASEYPVRIVQLANTNERSCGVGAQLAFQSSRGEYFYILDGDMTLEGAFLAEAIDFLNENPGAAAVGGRLVERNTGGESFEILQKTVETDRSWRPGQVKSLDGGGLYRSDAVAQVKYFADRNLHAFEEAELAMRLRAKGWTLHRLASHAVNHYGHTMGGYRLLMRRLKTGYASGIGEVVRASLGQPHFTTVLTSMKHVPMSAIVVVWWALLVLTLLLPVHVAIKIALIFVGIAVPLLFLAWRRASLRLGIYSLASWNTLGIGLIAGLFGRRVDPAVPISAVTLSS